MQYGQKKKIQKGAGNITRCMGHVSVEQVHLDKETIICVVVQVQQV